MECGARRRLATRRAGLRFPDQRQRGFDWAALKKKRDAYIERLNGIYERNLANDKVELVRGFARFIGPHTLEVDGRTHHRRGTSSIATGGRPMLPPVPGRRAWHHLRRVLRAAETMPARVVVVGSGYISVELGGVFAALGSKVTMVIRGETVLRSFDAMLGAGVLKAMRDEGVEFVTNGFPQALRAHGERRAGACAHQRPAPAAGGLRAVGHRARSPASSGSGSRRRA